MVPPNTAVVLLADAEVGREMKGAVATAEVVWLFGFSVAVVVRYLVEDPVPLYS
jgi:hypothetical protein